jgi:hypothetical protein
MPPEERIDVPVLTSEPTQQATCPASLKGMRPMSACKLQVVRPLATPVSKGQRTIRAVVTP